MVDGTLVFGGRSTDLELAAIERRWPLHELKIGQSISYDEMAQVIGHEKESNRFRTITVRWRKKVKRETTHIVGSLDGAFRVLTDAEKASLSRKRLSEAGSKMRRSWEAAASTDREKLDEADRKAFDFTTHKLAIVRAASQIKSVAALPSMTAPE